MATWYVRPDASHGGANNGTSFANAWRGWPAILWSTGGIVPGDTLYVCGGFGSSSPLSLGWHKATSDANRVVIRGDYSELPGSFTFTGTGYLNSTRIYTSFIALTIFGMEGFACILNAAAAGVIIDRCEFIGGTDGVRLNSSTVFTSSTVKNNVIHGQSAMGINHTVGTGSIAPGGIVINGNTIYGVALYAIQAAMNSSAWITSKFANYRITSNTIKDCPGCSIYIRSCHNDITVPSTIYSTDVEVAGNIVDRCGTASGNDGKHGGITVLGCASPLIFNNVVRDTYVTGAGIQTAKNQTPLIFFNTISGIRSGTPTAAFQNGLAIDGNGIFFDNLTTGGLAFGNRISDLISTGNTNSGTGLSIWDSTGVQFIGNIVDNCYCGASYGRANERDNAINNNTFINCDVGIDKVGASALAGNTTVKNNLLVNCGIGFRSKVNPSITADYNCVHGSKTAYSGIPPGAHDTSINPQLDSAYRPQNPRLKRAGIYLGGKDYNGKQFYNPPNIGAVDDMTSTPRYLLLPR